MFFAGKGVKYTIWAASTLFFWNYYLLKYKDKPEEKVGAIDFFMEKAHALDWHVQDIKLILTRPPMEKLLPDIP